MIKIKTGYYVGRTDSTQFLIKVDCLDNTYTRLYSDEDPHGYMPTHYTQKQMLDLLKRRQSFYLTSSKEIAFKFIKLMGWVNVWE